MNDSSELSTCSGRRWRSFDIHWLFLFGFDSRGGRIGSLRRGVWLRLTDTNAVKNVGKIVFSIGDQSLKRTLDSVSDSYVSMNNVPDHGPLERHSQL